LPRYEWTHERARCELEALLDRPVPDEHWQFLVDQEYVDELEHWDPADRRAQQLELSYRHLLRSGELVTGRRLGDRRAEFPVREPWLAADEMTLAAAIGEAMAQRANYIPGIARAHDLLRKGEVQVSTEDARRQWAERFEDSDLGIRRDFRALARQYGWHLEDAVVYVLAGWVAPVEPISASVWITEFPDEHGASAPRSRARIVLEFDPWVSLDTISNAYWTLRRRLIGPERKPPQAREIEAFRFVLWRLDQSGQPRESWSAIGREWNDEHQEDGWAYSKPGDIKRAYANGDFGSGYISIRRNVRRTISFSQERDHVA
jgi:hypothetical protein